MDRTRRVHTQFVQNEAPSLTMTGVGYGVEGNDYTISFSANDPGEDTISYWVVNWARGTTETFSDGAAGTSANHVYQTAGNYNINVQAYDEDGAYDTSAGVSIDYTLPTLFFSAPTSASEGDTITATFGQHMD